MRHQLRDVLGTWLPDVQVASLHFSEEHLHIRLFQIEIIQVLRWSFLPADLNMSPLVHRLEAIGIPIVEFLAL